MPVRRAMRPMSSTYAALPPSLDLVFFERAMSPKARRIAMPVRVVGMIGTTPPAGDATLHVLEGGLSPDYVTQFARAHDQAGFDLALVGYTSSSAENFLVALHAAARTETLGYLIAHRPGFV